MTPPEGEVHGAGGSDGGQGEGMERAALAAAPGDRARLRDAGASLLFLALFTYWPVVQVLWQSLHGQVRVGGPQAYVGAQNFLKLFADPAFRKALATTSSTRSGR